MTAQVRALGGVEPQTIDLDDIRARCEERRESLGGFLDQYLVEFGPRWGCIDSTLVGDRECLMELTLPCEYHSDLVDYELHPSLLDMATGGSQFLISGFDPKKDLFVPLEYDRIRVLGPMPGRILSHVRLLAESNDQFAFFDVTITDETGRVLVDVHRFTMTRLGKDAAILQSGSAEPVPEVDARNDTLVALLANAIAPAEGLAQLDRIMSQGEVAQVITSSVDVEHWLDDLNAEIRQGRGDHDSEDSIVFSRPVLETEFVEPKGSVQEQLAKIWASVLGIDQVGAHDDFFELGGHSLLATRLLARVRKELGLRLSIRAVFDQPRLDAFAAFVETQEAVSEDSSEISSDPDGRSASSDEELLATPAQLRFWYLDQIAGGVAAYNNVLSFRVRGSLDRQRLQAALDEVVARHEIFRTSFVLRDGELFQEIHEPFSVQIEEYEVGAMDAGHAPRVFEEQASTSIDVNSFPLFRVALATAGPDEHAIQLTLHHAICDGWTLGRLQAEIADLYSGESKENPWCQYREIQRAIPESERKEQLDFWRKQLGGELPSLELPSDHVRPTSLTDAGTNVFCTLPSLDRIREAAQAAGVTPFAFLVGTFHILCSRWSGEDDFCIGAPFSQRDEEEREAFGPELNTITLRFPPADPVAPLTEHLASVKDTCLDAYQHRDVAFEQVIQELSVERRPDAAPVFQVVFALDDTRTLAPFGMGDLECEHLRIPIHSSRTDLSVWMTPTATGIEARWEYSTDLFDRDMIERLVDSYQQLLAAALTDPRRPVGQLPLVDVAQVDELTVVRNRTSCEFPEGLSIHAAFEAQVDRTPDAVAVDCEGQTLTYAELDRRANLLAHRLRALGADRGEIVGLSVPRQADMLTGLLAILKTGAAYLPLDPEYPAERLSLMLDDSEVSLVIGTAATRPMAGLVAVVELDTFDFDSGDATRLATPSDPEDLAYVIYTSGSTGRPKGVMVEHRNVSNFFTAMDQVLEFEPGKVGTWVSVTSISFDISVLELFWCLSRGYKVVLQAGDLRTEISTSDLLLEHRADHFQCTPSQARMLLAETSADEALAGLGKMLVGGEALPTDLAVELREKVSGDVINMYGPTETTIWSACHRLHEEDSVTVPIGKPVANTALYVLDHQLCPVPEGVVGELYIGGAGVVRGYLGQDNLTHERFLVDAFRGDGARMYRTGDCVRYREDGTLQFCGRTDHQVKLRGHRIEMGEIESQLRGIDGVSEAVAIVREDEPGDQRLVAYLVGANGIDEEQIRRMLLHVLPDYMVPNAIVELEALPLTPNGKIDRKILPDPRVATQRPNRPGFIAPRNDVEVRLSVLWQDLLGVSAVGVRDGFFDLGGHSLLTLRLASRIEAEFQAPFAPAQIFVGPTIEQIARVLTGSSVLTNRALIPLQGDGDGAPIYCMCGIHLYQDLALALGNDQPFIAMYVPEEEAVFGSSSDASGSDIEKLARAYYEMILTRHDGTPLRLLGFCFGGAIAFEVARLAEADGIDVEHVIFFEAVLWSRLKRRNLNRVRGLLRRTVTEGLGTVVESIAARRRQSCPSGSDTLGIEERLATLAYRMIDYVPGGALESNAILIRTNDPDMYGTWKVSPLLGWEPYLKQETRTIVVESSHTGILRSPVVDQIADQLKQVFAESSARMVNR